MSTFGLRTGSVQDAKAHPVDPKALGPLQVAAGPGYAEVARRVQGHPTIILCKRPPEKGAKPARGWHTSGVTGSGPKADLHRYLQEGRESLLWKLDGLSEYDVRRPLVASGTNLLGLVKHLASLELTYFGETFGRPSGELLPWFEDDAEVNADMWASAEESREQLVDLYRRSWVHADTTIDELTLDAIGRVPWWSEDRQEVTLHRILAHMTAETQRHAGHADIVRELIDGAAGLHEGKDYMAPGDRLWWDNYRDRLERVAREADGG
jgi:uncharacterized damage-inducible protein DinB